VKLISINSIIDRGFGGIAPHFLSIDAESVDFEILRTLDFDRFRPWVICTEKSRPAPDFDALLRPRRYRLICEAPHNLMFILDHLPGAERSDYATVG
jgi:hypothetical protein